MRNLILHHPVDQHFNVKAKNVVAHNDVRVQLLDLGEEKAEELPLCVGLLDLGDPVLGLVDADAGPVVGPGFVLRFGEDAVVLVERLFGRRRLVQAEGRVGQATQHCDLILMGLGVYHSSLNRMPFFLCLTKKMLSAY